MDVTAPTLSLTRAASIAGLSATYVRGLLTNRYVVLMAAPSPRGRAAKACVLDVLRFRVLRVLRDAGLCDVHAIYALDLAFDPVLGGFAGCGIAVELPFLLDRVAGGSFFVVPDEADDFPDIWSVPAGTPAPAYAETAIAVHLEPILAAVLAGIPTETAGTPAQEFKS